MSTTLSTRVIDFGASDHMTGNKAILFTLNSVSSLFFVILTDGSTSYIKGLSAANTIPSLLLSYVLYIIKFLSLIHI